MTARKYKKKLNSQAKEVKVPNVLIEIRQADFSAYKTTDHNIIPQTITKKKALILKVSSAIAAFSLVFIFIIAHFALNKFDSNVYAMANINISETTTYSIDINKNSNVIKITADNLIGETILQKFEYKHKKFDIVLTDLLKSCVDYWDLSEEQLVNALSFSVNCHDNSKIISFEHQWNESINEARQHCSNRHNNGHH